MSTILKDKNNKSIAVSDLPSKATNRLFQILLEIEVYILWIIGYFPVAIVRTFFYKISGVKIGRGSVINTGARMYNPENIEIGEDTIIGEQVVLDGRSKLVIGSHVDMASQVMIYNSEHDINNPSFSAIEEPVRVGDYVFIGPRAIILPGVKIGKGAIIGAGAVVTKDIPDFEIAGGVPAKRIGERNLKNPDYRLRRKGIFDLF